MKDWNLSEKIQYGYGCAGEDVVETRNIKEFLKRLKEDINEPWTNGVGQCICPKCWNDREVDEKVTKECMFKEINEVIDKLAGSALTELPYKTYTDPKLAGGVKEK